MRCVAQKYGKEKIDLFVAKYFIFTHTVHSVLSTSAQLVRVLANTYKCNIELIASGSGNECFQYPKVTVVDLILLYQRVRISASCTLGFFGKAIILLNL